MKVWIVAPLLAVIIGGVGAQSVSASDAALRRIINECPRSFSGLIDATPIKAGSTVTSQEAPALRQFAFRRNRQQIFRDAARAYGQIALSGAAASQAGGENSAGGHTISEGERWEAEALEAVNISNLGRTEEADAILTRLEGDIAGGAGLRPAQLALFRAINAAQDDRITPTSTASLELALRYASRIPALIQAANIAGVGGQTVGSDGAVTITVRDSERFNQAQSVSSQKGAFASTLGRRPLTDSERAAIILAQGAWLEARVHLLQASMGVDQTNALVRAESALSRAVAAQSGFGQGDALWLQALIQSAAADLAIARNNPAQAVAASERAVLIVSSYVNQDASAAPIVSSVRRTLAEAYHMNGEFARARQQFKCAFDISASTSALAPITTREVEPYLDVLFTDARAGNPEAQAEFFRVASAASDGAAREVQAQSALWLSANIESQPLLRQILNKERELASLTASLDNQEIRQLPRNDPARTAIMRGIAELEAQLSADRAAAGYDPRVALGALGLSDLAQPFMRERGLSAVVAVQSAQANLDAVRRALRTQGDEAFLMYFVGERSVYGVAVTRDVTRVFRVEDSPASLIRDARAYTDRMRPLVLDDGRVFRAIPLWEGRSRSNPNVITRADMFDVGASLYQRLLPPEIQPLLSTVQNLVINSQGALSELPFPALLTRPISAAERAAIQRSTVNGESNYSSAPWLVKEKGVSVAVSASAFPLTRNLPPRGSQGGQALAFASTPPPGAAKSEAELNALVDVLLDRLARSRTRGFSAAERQNCRSELLSVLQSEADEALRIGAESALRAFDPNTDMTVSLRDGRQFTDAALQGDLTQYRLIYFGAHGIVPPPNSCLTDPLLVTSLPSVEQAQSASLPGRLDGLLTASEIFSLRLDADLVVLAACNTGRVQQDASREESIRRFGLDGRGVVGTLAQSFMVAGARAVLVTHWEVGKDATQEFMRDYFGALGRPGVTYSEAMLLAQRAQVNQARFSHPYYWAPFVFVGDGQRPFKPAVG